MVYDAHKYDDERIDELLEVCSLNVASPHVMTLEDAILLSTGEVPQPQGKIVAQAYRTDELSEPSTMLQVIAVLLAHIARLHSEWQEHLKRDHD